MDYLQQFRQDEALRFIDCWVNEPEKFNPILKILAQEGKAHDYVRSLDIIRTEQFYFLLPLIFRYNLIDGITEYTIVKHFVQKWQKIVELSSLDLVCETLQHDIITEINATDRSR